MANRDDVNKTLAAMAKMHGKQMDSSAVDMFIADLEEYEPGAILYALQQCRKEIPGFPTIAHIVSRIKALDGRPGVEEAWSLAPKDEFNSAYLNEEIMQAWSVANDVLKAGDNLISARMAFKEVYERVVRENRQKNKAPKWWLSRAAGANRENEDRRALQDAVDKGRLMAADASLMLPDFGKQRANLQLPTSSPSAQGFDEAPDAFSSVGEVIKKLAEKHL